MVWTCSTHRGRWIVLKYEGLDCIPLARSCEHSNKFSSSVKSGKCHNRLGECQLLKENSAP
jgi:hypothetical protein